MQKEKRKQSKDEENDSSSQKRRKADLTAMTEPESSRSRPEGAYDVFLSFRGEDTRKTFTDHLYTALVQAGIHTFRDDDELPRGEEISDHLLRAVQESKISIVVFSKGYASSRWCLNELVEILKCKHRKTGQIVLPIFYDIDPSYVRKQDGSFAEAFVKHEERFEEKFVKEWRKALEEAGNLSGWNLNDMANGHEAKFIKGIIKDVLNKLRCECLYVPEHLVGMDLAHDIYDFLNTATDGVHIVGIHAVAPQKNQARGIGWRIFLRFAGKGLVVVREGISTPNAPYLSVQEQWRRVLPRATVTGGAWPSSSSDLAAVVEGAPEASRCKGELVDEEGDDVSAAGFFGRGGCLVDGADGSASVRLDGLHQEEYGAAASGWGRRCCIRSEMRGAAVVPVGTAVEAKKSNRGRGLVLFGSGAEEEEVETAVGGGEDIGRRMADLRQMKINSLGRGERPAVMMRRKRGETAPLFFRKVAVVYERV
ncbi:hypothetical protein NC651_039441 [Populus alba x Populus x berolinensis]|nr:hypothetical protein NC651_039441 [Populus alba x Populus x berolinensis]